MFVAKRRDRNKPENIDNNDQLQEIVPDKEEEQHRQDLEAILRKKTLDELKRRELEEKEQEREDRKKKSNKTRRQKGGRL